MDEKVGKFIFWTPRILSIIFIIFLALMSLDVFGTGLSFWQTMIGLFMHNIPVFILSAILVISWKYEIVGGIVFILLGILYIVMMGRIADWKTALILIAQISGTAFIIGGFFIANWLKKRKRN